MPLGDVAQPLPFSGILCGAYLEDYKLGTWNPRPCQLCDSESQAPLWEKESFCYKRPRSFHSPAISVKMENHGNEICKLIQLLSNVQISEGGERGVEKHRDGERDRQAGERQAGKMGHPLPQQCPKWSLQQIRNPFDFERGTGPQLVEVGRWDSARSRDLLCPALLLMGSQENRRQWGPLEAPKIHFYSREDRESRILFFLPWVSSQLFLTPSGSDPLGTVKGWTVSEQVCVSLLWPEPSLPAEAHPLPQGLSPSPPFSTYHALSLHSLPQRALRAMAGQPRASAVLDSC
ncbi:hypothetical protein MC885_000646, partial [Smutsia gigantea]